MNLILLFNADLPADGAHVTLSGRRFDHIRSVHRAKPGDRLRIGRLNGLMGHGIVTDMTDQSISLDIVLDTPPPPPLPCTVCIALPRPKTLRKVLQSATALGVKKIFIMRTWRVEKSYWQSPLLAPEALFEQIVLGLEQGCDTVTPVIEMRPLFKPFAEDEIPGLITGSLALAAHPGATGECPRASKAPVVLAIGPEGGFIEYEMALLTKQGFGAVSLGQRILRVDDALPALIGRLF
jgi:16S rRNA (uracil1498-N3)-methyltransferase